MANITPEISGLLRKHADTQEPAKRNELANLLRAHGIDPDAVGTVSAPSRPLPSRTAPVKATTTAPKRATAARVEPEDKEAVKETAVKTASVRRRPGRPRKTENTDK